MKKEYVYCIISLIFLGLGITCCIAALLVNNLAMPSQSLLAVFGTCFILIGIMSYTDHIRKYLKIKLLKDNEVSVLAHWTFTPNSSHYINETLHNNKLSTCSTAVLTLVLCLVIACCIYLSGEKHSTLIASSLILLSLITTAIALMSISYYYNSKLASPSEVLIGEDCIYFIDNFYTLQRSMYFLQDIKINYETEDTLQFSYGDNDLFNDPVYVINIPIPPGELGTAKLIQQHYTTLIHYE